jgi:hypothetical protein
MGEDLRIVFWEKMNKFTDRFELSPDGKLLLVNYQNPYNFAQNVRHFKDASEVWPLDTAAIIQHVGVRNLSPLKAEDMKKTDLEKVYLLKGMDIVSTILSEKTEIEKFEFARYFRYLATRNIQQRREYKVIALEIIEALLGKNLANTIIDEKIEIQKIKD